MIRLGMFKTPLQALNLGLKLEVSFILVISTPVHPEAFELSQGSNSHQRSESSASSPSPSILFHLCAVEQFPLGPLRAFLEDPLLGAHSRLFWVSSVRAIACYNT